MSVNPGAAGVATGVEPPLRYTRYPTTPTLSVLASQASCAVEVVTATTRRLAGTVGDSESAADGVTACTVAGGETSPAPLIATTV